MLVRQFAIPNPFEALGEGLTIYIEGAPLLLTPNVLNWIAEPAIHFLTFAVVGLYYSRGDGAALGSFLYMVFYVIHIVLLYLILSVYPITWLMIAIVIAYIAAHIGLNVLWYRQNWGI